MSGFFSEVHVEGSDNVPVDGPLLVCCTHWNMIVDPAILSCWFPHKRKLHYWAKSTIFINAPVSALLRDAGNIPVDRKTKDNKKLFSGTFDVLRLGECVAIFPEGTSYTQPSMQDIKEGAAWAALEYEKDRAVDAKDKGRSKNVQMVVASIVYTKKTDYRSRVVVSFSPPIDLEQYKEDFIRGSTEPDKQTENIDSTATAQEKELAAHKKAVKALTAKIKRTMESMTINSPDWDTLHAAEMARQLLWGDDDNVPLSEWTRITQTMIELFSPNAHTSDKSAHAKAALVRYDATLRQLRYTNASLNAIPLPRILDPLHPAPVPDRLRTLWALFKATFSSLKLLPFFILPLLAHLPIYIIGKATQYYVNAVDAEEFAQNKIVFSLLVLLLFIYPAIFFFTWALCLFTPIGLFIALGWTAAFSVYHTRLVDANYKQWKRLVVAWRVLASIWWPTLLSTGKQQLQASTGTGQSDSSTAVEDTAKKSSGGNARRMLRERSEAANAAADLLLALERDGQWADKVDFLRSCGARIGYTGPVQETDRHGRLKQT